MVRWYNNTEDVKREIHNIGPVVSGFDEGTTPESIIEVYYASENGDVVGATTIEQTKNVYKVHCWNADIKPYILNKKTETMKDAKKITLNYRKEISGW